MAEQVTAKDYSWNNKDQVIIKSASLINALIGDEDKAITTLSSISPITLSNIIVDEYGTVIVTDASFKSKVESLLPSGPSGSSSNNVSICVNISSCLEEAVIQ
jgi:hypothetical protein